MAGLPDLTQFCIQLFPSAELCIVLPGDTEICAIFPGCRPPDPSELTAAFLGQINSALAPLTPIFNIIDVVVALVNCVKAVESALGPPPNPSKLTQCFPQLAKALQRLLALLPFLTIPALVGSLLDVLIAHLTGIKNQLVAIIRKQLRIALAQTRAVALGSVALNTVLDCASGDLDVFLNNLNAQSAPLGRLINLINALLSLAGASPIPSIGSIGQDANAAVAPLTAVIAELQIVRKAFP